MVFSEGAGAVGPRDTEPESAAERELKLSCYRDLAQAERCYLAGPAKLTEEGRVVNLKGGCE